MARYIEAVKSAEIVSEKLNIPLGDLVDIFAEIPTADVVKVVRCKDCVACEEFEPNKFHCKNTGYYCGETGYCSDGVCTPQKEG